jgi:hypothetical protein
MALLFLDTEFETVWFGSFILIPLLSGAAKMSNTGVTLPRVTDSG